MLWRLSVAVVLVVCAAGGVCSGVQADLMSRLLIPRDFGVKLCGREFIRAVIFTCGGSRWRRDTGEGDLDPFQWTSLSDVTLQEEPRSWLSAAGLPESPSSLHAASSSSSSPSSYSLSDLLALFGRQQQQQQQQQHPLGDPVALQVAQPDAAEWPPMSRSRSRRNFSLGVAGKCCSQGCTKNDIGRLC